MTPVDGTRQSQPCDVPVPDRAPGNARLYPCGWRCTTHAPRSRVTPVNGLRR